MYKEISGTFNRELQPEPKRWPGTRCNRGK